MKEPVIVPDREKFYAGVDVGAVDTLDTYVHHLTISRIRLLTGLGAYKLAELVS